MVGWSVSTALHSPGGVFMRAGESGLDEGKIIPALSRELQLYPPHFLCQQYSPPQIQRKFLFPSLRDIQYLDQAPQPRYSDFSLHPLPGKHRFSGILGNQAGKAAHKVFRFQIF